jgi:asparaginyl-tRNA synthetase
MVEPEIAFADLSDNAHLAEQLLKHCLKVVLEKCQEDLAFFNARIDSTVMQRLETMVNEPFERMEYTDAIKILEASGQSFEFPVAWGLDLQSEHERYLTEQHVGRPIVLMNYPKDIKAFYMRLNDDHKTVAAMDVLAPGIGEIVGGSQREERLDVLDARIPDDHMRNSLWWYRDLRRYGTVPHAGFGLGFERLLNYVTGMDNIRDAIPFPRTPGHADF